jgi:hypothetical protein
MDQSSEGVLRGLGGNPAGFRARRLAVERVESAGLTLTMTRPHRRDVLKPAPRAMFCTYTPRWAANLLGHVASDLLPPLTPPADRLRALATVLGKRRATRRSADRMPTTSATRWGPEPTSIRPAAARSSEPSPHCCRCCATHRRSGACRGFFLRTPTSPRRTPRRPGSPATGRRPAGTTRACRPGRHVPHRSGTPRRRRSDPRPR